MSTRRVVAVGLAIGSATGALVAVGSSLLVLSTISAAISAGSYTTSDALGPFGTALFFLMSTFAPAVLLGAALGTAVGLVVAIHRSRQQSSRLRSGEPRGKPV